MVAKQRCIPLKKKEKHEWHSCPSKKKRERRKGKVNDARYKTIEDIYLHSHLHLTHVMSIWTTRRH